MVTVAGGRFAPGHIGELTRIVPFEMVDAALAETNTVQRRLRALYEQIAEIDPGHTPKLCTVRNVNTPEQ